MQQFPQDAVDPFELLTRTETHVPKQVWAIGGGKGGVGKSLVSANTAISLARDGQRVVAIDLDLGGANLHTSLGVDLPKQTLSDFLSGRVGDLQKCVSPTGIPNLGLISGAQDSVLVTRVTAAQRKELWDGIRTLNADIVIVDLGAGTADYTIDFFLRADVGVVVLLPEPTSIENVYRFIKSAYYRALMETPSLHEIRPLIQAATDTKNTQGIRSPSDLFREISRSHPELIPSIKKEIESFSFKLMLNQVRTQTDVGIGFSVKSVCKKYFGMDLDYVGYLDYDSSVWQAVRRKRPMLTEFPNSQISYNIDKITRHLLRRHGEQRSRFGGGQRYDV